VEDAYRAALDRFEDDLRARRLSPHTVRGYVADLADLFTFAESAGLTDPHTIGLDIARSWLAESATSGAARATLARRTAAARAWSRQAAVPGLTRLATPKPRSPLPAVLSQRQMSDTLTAAATAAAAQDPLALRDLAILEFLYATAARVSELCALNVDDLDFTRRTARLTGKGGRDRTVPFGLPAERALRAWLSEDARGVVLAGWVGGGGGKQKTVKNAATSGAHTSAPTTGAPNSTTSPAPDNASAATSRDASAEVAARDASVAALRDAAAAAQRNVATAALRDASAATPSTTAPLRTTAAPGTTATAAAAPTGAAATPGTTASPGTIPHPGNRPAPDTAPPSGDTPTPGTTAPAPQPGKTTFDPDAT